MVNDQNSDPQDQVRKLTDDIKATVSNESYAPDSKGVSAPRKVRQDFMPGPETKTPELDVDALERYSDITYDRLDPDYESSSEDEQFMSGIASADINADPVLKYMPWVYKNAKYPRDVYSQFDEIYDAKRNLSGAEAVEDEEKRNTAVDAAKDDLQQALRKVFGNLYLTRNGFTDTGFFTEKDSPLSADSVRTKLSLSEDDAAAYNMSTLRGARDYLKATGDLDGILSAVREAAQGKELSDEEALRMYLKLGRAYDQADKLTINDVPDMYRYATLSLMDKIPGFETRSYEFPDVERFLRYRYPQLEGDDDIPYLNDMKRLPDNIYDNIIGALTEAALRGKRPNVPAEEYKPKISPDQWEKAVLSALRSNHLLGGGKRAGIYHPLKNIPEETKSIFNLGNFPMDVKDKAQDVAIDTITNEPEEKGKRSEFNPLSNIIPTVPWITGREKALKDDSQGYDSRGTAGGQQSLGVDIPLRYVPDAVRSSRVYGSGQLMSRGYQQSGAVSVWDAFGVIPGQEATTVNSPFWGAVAQIASADPALVRMKDELVDTSQILPAYKKAVSDSFGVVGKDEEYRDAMQTAGKFAAVPTLLEILAHHSNDPQTSATAAKMLSALKTESGKGYGLLQKGMNNPYGQYDKTLKEAYTFVRGALKAGMPEVPPELMPAYSNQMYNTLYNGSFTPVEGLSTGQYLTPSSARLGNIMGRFLRKDAGVEGAAPAREAFTGAVDDYQAVFGENGLLNGPNKMAYLSNAASIAADKLRERYDIKEGAEGVNPFLAARIAALDSAARKLAEGGELSAVEQKVMRAEGVDPNDPKTLLGAMLGLDSDNIDTVYGALFEGQDTSGKTINDTLQEILGREGGFTDDVARSQKYAIYRELIKGLRARLQSPEAPDSGLGRPDLSAAARYAMVRRGKDRLGRRHTNPASVQESAVRAALAKDKKYRPFWSWTDLKPAMDRYVSGEATEDDTNLLQNLKMIEDVPYTGMYFGKNPAKQELARYYELEDYMKGGFMPAEGMDPVQFTKDIDTVQAALKAEGVESLDELSDPDAQAALANLRKNAPFSLPESRPRLAHGQDRWGAKLYADATDNGKRPFDRGEYEKMPGILTLANAMTGLDDYESLEDELSLLNARKKNLSKYDKTRYYDLKRQLDKIKANAQYAANLMLWANRRQKLLNDEERITAASARKYAEDLAEQEEIEDKDQFLTGVDELISLLTDKDIDYTDEWSDMVDSLLYEGTDPKELAKYTYPDAYPEESKDIWISADKPSEWAPTIEHNMPELLTMRDKIYDYVQNKESMKPSLIRKPKTNKPKDGMSLAEEEALKAENSDFLDTILPEYLALADDPQFLQALADRGYPSAKIPGRTEGEGREELKSLMKRVIAQIAMNMMRNAPNMDRKKYESYFKSEQKVPVLRVKKA